MADAALTVERWARRLRAASLGFALIAAAFGGTALTLRIGAAGSMLAITDSFEFIAQINATAHAVVFGWLGLWAMAAAWRTLPRTWAVDLPGAGWCAPIALLAIGGIGLRSVVQLVDPRGVGLAALGSALETVALLLFALQILALRARRTRRVAAVDALAPLALAFTVAAAIADAWHAWRIGTAVDLVGLVAAVKVSQPPLRDLQLHGMALSWVLMLAWTTGGAQPNRRAVVIAAWLLALAVVGEVGLYLAYRVSGDHVWAMALPLAWLLIGGAFLIFVARRRWWSATPVPPGLRAAFAWFAIALALRLLFRPYHVALGAPFSHAYFAALGQAAAVGFVAQALIALDDAATGRRSPAVLIALNLGCALHIAGMIGTDWHPAWKTPLIVAGLIEGAAIAAWVVARAAVRRRSAG
ncbi:MAG TPA: hypothetical protein VEL07_20985 [Planctomycetota bacterium]|nr:hypothetical protein [Planctomycetota bacterium]